MTAVTLNLEDGIKRELDVLVENMGMNLSTFFMIYIKKSLRERKIPFEITAPTDPFFSERNMERLRESEQQFREGNVVIKTMEELEAMANA